MTFNISSTICWKNEKMLGKYPCLKDFGYKEVERSVPTGYWIKDEYGYSILWQEGPNRIVYDPVIEINSLEELISLINAVDCELVISDTTIEIYDSYRE